LYRALWHSTRFVHYNPDAPGEVAQHCRGRAKTSDGAHDVSCDDFRN
jgi:hypothetical protein